MSDADVIRRAAEALRTSAEQATPGPWEPYDANEGLLHRPLYCVANDAYHNPPAGSDVEWPAIDLHIDTGVKADADYIARMHPGVGRALAEWLDFEAEHDCCEPSALTVARAILGEQS